MILEPTSAGHDGSAVLVRKMTPADIPDVMPIEEESFLSPWTVDMMENELSVKNSHYLVADEDGKILGFTGYWQVLDEGHIMNIAVKKDSRAKGIGSLLMDAMLEDGRKRGILYWTLEVRVSNDPARRLYEKKQFELAGVRPGYYASPKEDACIYWRKDA